MKIKLTLAIFMGLFAFLLTHAKPAHAFEYATSYEVDLEEALKGVEGQHFTSISSGRVVDYLRHFVNDTAGYNKTPNGYGWSSTGSDSKYSTDLLGGKEGCFHYADFVSKTIYGSSEATETKLFRKEGESYTIEGLRDFVKRELQAGEHFRFDPIHSLIFISSDEEGIYTLQYYGRWTDPFFSYMSYEEMLRIINASGTEVYLYNYEGASNGISHLLNGWVERGGKLYYYKNSVMQIGWQKIDGSWYYLSSDGVSRGLS